MTATTLTALGISVNASNPDIATALFKFQAKNLNSPPRVHIGQPAFYSTKCADAYKAVRWYRARYDKSRTELGYPLAPRLETGMDCERLRERAAYWVKAAKVNRLAVRRWRRLNWAAPPEPFLSIARCEQRSDSGLHGVDWQAYSGSYEGGYGFAHSTWDQFKPDGYPAGAHQATILQQTNVARILVARFGGYSSWPACHIRLGLPG